MKIGEAIKNLTLAMKDSGIVPRNGLGTELFHFASTLMPVVNVDLLVFNEKKEILLSWRDDVHSGRGWHIPGGCIRLGEHFEERIQKTAILELGTVVETDSLPVAIYEIFSTANRCGLENQNERSHFITLAFLCRLPERYQITEKEDYCRGTLKWFPTLPEDLLEVQNCYKAQWAEIIRKVE